MTPGAEAAAAHDAATAEAEEALRRPVPPRREGRLLRREVLRRVGPARAAVRARLDLGEALVAARMALLEARAPLDAVLRRLVRRRRALTARLLLRRARPVLRLLAALALALALVGAAVAWQEEILRLLRTLPGLLRPGAVAPTGLLGGG